MSRIRRTAIREASLLCDILAYGECLADIDADRMICPYFRAEDKGPDFFDLRQPLFAQHFLIHFHIDHFSDELGMETYLYGFQQPAFQNHRELRYIRCVNKFGMYRGELRCSELVQIPSRYHAYMVHHFYVLF